MVCAPSQILVLQVSLCFALRNEKNFKHVMPTQLCFSGVTGLLACFRGRNTDSDSGDMLPRSERRIGAIDICCEVCDGLSSIGASTKAGIGGTGGGGEAMVGLGGGER